MDPLGIIIWIVLGAVAGFLAGKIMSSGGSLITNIVVGIIGAFFGGVIFSALGISAGSGLIGSIITAVCGAVALLFVLGFVQKGKEKVLD